MVQKCPNYGMNIEENDLKCKNCGKQLKVRELTHEEISKILQKHAQPTGFDPILLTTINFSDFWRLLSEKLKELTLIRNWTVYSGFIGVDFKAVYSPTRNVVRYYLPDKREPGILDRSEFKFVFDKWNDYIKGNIKRTEFGKIRTSKYVISIIYHVIAVPTE